MFLCLGINFLYNMQEVRIFRVRWRRDFRYIQVLAEIQIAAIRKNEYDISASFRIDYFFSLPRKCGFRRRISEKPSFFASSHAPSVAFCVNARRSAIFFSLVMASSSTRSLCLPKYFVALCMTMSALNSNDHRKYGVMKVLSTIVST